MKGIYNYIPETNHFSRVYNVAAIPQLQFLLHVMLLPMLNVLHFYISIAKMCVQRQVRLFSAVPWFRTSPVCCSGIFWIILRWCQFPVLLLISLLFLHSTYKYYTGPQDLSYETPIAPNQSTCHYIQGCGGGYRLLSQGRSFFGIMTKKKSKGDVN